MSGDEAVDPEVDRRLALPDVPPRPWQFKRTETCMLCHEREPKWLVSDSKEHVYYEMVEDKKGDDLVLKTRRQEDGYLICDKCQEMVARLNRTARKSRQLTFIRWSVDGAGPQPDVDSEEDGGGVQEAAS